MTVGKRVDGCDCGGGTELFENYFHYINAALAKALWVLCMRK